MAITINESQRKVCMMCWDFRLVIDDGQINGKETEKRKNSTESKYIDAGALVVMAFNEARERYEWRSLVHECEVAQ